MLVATATFVTAASGGRSQTPASGGGKIAFVRGSTNVHGDLIGDIYVMYADGTRTRRLTRNGTPDSEPAWSPDGREIIFHGERYRGNRTYNGLWVMGADGSNQRSLTREGDIDPAWSPDGNHIASARLVCPKGSLENCQFEIYLLASNGAGLRRLTRDRADDVSPTWSPDSRRVAFARTTQTGKSAIYVMTADGTNQRRLTPASLDGAEPAWSPSGRSIAFAGARPGGDFYLKEDIWVMNADGSGPRRLTTSSGPETHPDWPPDGRQIVFEHDLTSRHGYLLGTDNIEVMNADGGGQHSLTHNPHPRFEYLNVQPAWQPKVP